MEFFQDIDTDPIDVEWLRSQLLIGTLSDCCDSIDAVLSGGGDRGEIYCIWGQFTVSRESIKNGVRFALLNCPHALAWTIAYHADRGTIVVHCTIDDREESPEFVETIDQFVSDWAQGVRSMLG